MIKKIVVNLTTTALAAISALLSTVGIIANLESVDYGLFGLAVLITNSVGLLNVFRPRVLSLILKDNFDVHQAVHISAAALGLAIIIFIILLFFLEGNFHFYNALGIAVASFFAFIASVLADEVDGRGYSVYTATSRNLMWLAFYPVAFLSSSLYRGSIGIMIWLLALCFIFLGASLFLKASSFRQVSLAALVKSDIGATIAGNIKMGLTNLSSLVLGTADRMALSYATPNSSTFGVYSAISDMFMRTHVFFRVASSVITSEITSGRIDVRKLWIYVIFLIYILILISFATIHFLPVLLRPLHIRETDHFFVASMFCSTIPLVACGYFSAAILYAKGDVRSLFITYVPFSFYFVITTIFVASQLNYLAMSFVYASSRLSDLFLLKRAGAKNMHIFFIFIATILGWLTGLYLYG